MANKPTINPENIGAGLGELKSRLLFLLFAIFVYRVGTHIPVPGIDPLQLSQFFTDQEGTFTDMINMFGGGALYLGLYYHATFERGKPAARSTQEGR
jgi:preprotein translocase subunit SecY